MHYIYKITNILNGKVYIGRSNKATERWKQHKYFVRKDKPVQYIHRAMKKDGVDNFTYEVIDFAFNPWQADCIEMGYVEQYNSRNKEKGYNIAPGGKHAWNAGLPKELRPSYGRLVSEETRRKISESNMGKIMPPRSKEWRALMSSILTGRKYSKEHVDKARQGRLKSLNGYNHTEETKKRLSKSHMGLYVGEKSPLAKLTWNIVRAMRKDFVDGLRLIDISKKYEVHPQTVRDVCKGKTWRE
jgi:group I intron endonuclease